MSLVPSAQLKWLLLVLATTLLLMMHFAIASPAHAATSPPSSVGNNMVAKCDDFPGISNRIVKCVRTTLNNASGRFFSGFYPLISRAITAFITLGVVIYGVMLSMGMVEKLGRDTIVLLVKIAFVAYFVQHTDVLYQWIIQSMDSLAASMFNFSGTSIPGAPVCMMNKASIWERLDCLIDTTFGIKTTVANTAAATTGAGAASSDATSNVNISGQGLARGLVAFLASAMFSSVPGFIIGIVGFMFLYTMLFFMVKAMFTFLMAYIAIMFLMIIGPFFIPLVIFRASKQYFDNWVKLVVGCALQPVIIVTFVSFAVAGIDVTVFTGDRSFVRTIAGDVAKQKGFNLNEYIDSKGAYIDKPVGPTIKAESSRNDAQNTTVEQTVMGTMMSSECGLTKGTGTGPGGLPGTGVGALTAAQGCAKGFIAGIEFRSIDWKKLAEARQPAVDTAKTNGNKEKALMNDLYASAILTAVMVFIMNALMRVVPEIANDLLGSYRNSPNMFGLAGKWKSQNMLEGQANSLTQQIRQSGNTGGQQRQ